MDATKSFDIDKAFSAIDDWRYGYIDKKNLKSFLRKHNYLASTAECMAIIRRLDLDADARLSKQEFADGLRPEEPFNKQMKRKQMSKGPKSRYSLTKGATAKNGSMLMLTDDQRNAVRTQALDRTHGRLKKGTTPLKVRPVIVKDLSIFGTPRSQKRKKRVRKVLAPDEELDISPRSNHSRRSSRSTKRLAKVAFKRPQSSTMGHRKSRKSVFESTR